MQPRIHDVLVFRELSRTDEAGVVTTVNLLIGRPEPFKDPATGFDGFRCLVQILGLQPNPPPGSVASGFVHLNGIALDPLDALLKAVHTARVVLDATPEGRAGRLAWKDMPGVPGYGLPKKVIELTELVRDAYVHMSPSQQAFWDGLLDGVPMNKSGMVHPQYQSQTWQELQAAPLTALQSVSPAEALVFSRMGITTVAQLAAYLPARVARCIVHAANPVNPILD